MSKEDPASAPPSIVSPPHAFGAQLNINPGPGPLPDSAETDSNHGASDRELEFDLSQFDDDRTDSRSAGEHAPLMGTSLADAAVRSRKPPRAPRNRSDGLTLGGSSSSAGSTSSVSDAAAKKKVGAARFVTTKPSSDVAVNVTGTDNLGVPSSSAREARSPVNSGPPSARSRSSSNGEDQPLSEHDDILANKAVDEIAERFEHLMAQIPVTLGTEHLARLRARVNKQMDCYIDADIVDPVVHATIVDAPITLSTLLKDVWGRCSWLAGLLLLQSSSSFILERFSKLIETHLVVTFFLTMLVGAGGNAGNQSAVMVIRGLATGTVREDNKYKILWRQLITGFLMSIILVCFGYFRVVLFGSDALSAFAISLSLFFIVVVSVIAGTLLPLGLHAIGTDPAHAGPTIQVFMDIVGVYITCVVCSAMFGGSAAMLGPAVNPTAQPAQVGAARVGMPVLPNAPVAHLGHPLLGPASNSSLHDVHLAAAASNLLAKHAPDGAHSAAEIPTTAAHIAALQHAMPHLAPENPEDHEPHSTAANSNSLPPAPAVSTSRDEFRDSIRERKRARDRLRHHIAEHVATPTEPAAPADEPHSALNTHADTAEPTSTAPSDSGAHSDVLPASDTVPAFVETEGAHGWKSDQSEREMAPIAVENTLSPLGASPAA